VQAIGVKLCPAPMHFTRCPAAAASWTMATSSPSVDGRRIEVGAHDWLPAQFVHDVRSFMLTDGNLAARLLVLGTDPAGIRTNRCPDRGEC
jgi:hypothetical protein